MVITVMAKLWLFALSIIFIWTAAEYIVNEHVYTLITIYTCPI